MRRTRTTLLCLSLLTAAAVPAAAGQLAPAAEGSASLAPRADADSSEQYFTSSDGITRLHADVLRPKGLPADAKTPVVLTVSPYTSHAGQTPTEVNPTGEGPSPRFDDLLDGTKLLENGYTYVMVDLPGFGGSGGCNDWGGNREQGAVRAAVEWAASQSWSSGKVALLGKSYDGWTGLMGVAQQPRGLAAVVSMEPVFSGYRYIWMNGVRRTSTTATVTSFQAGDAKPGSLNDSPEYLLNSAPQAYCYPVNSAGALADDSPTGPYWAERDLGPTADGKQTPVFLTQGFLETNTRQDGAFAYWNALDGDHNRAWFGQFDHVRGWEKTADGARYQTGRDAFFAELTDFLGEHLKGVAPKKESPTIAVQDAQGRYRAEAQWPPADSRLLRTELPAGTYTDDGSGSALRPAEDDGLWSVSAPLAEDAWLSGEPVVTVGATSLPSANLAADVYDIAPDGTARKISGGVSLLRGVGAKSASYRLYGQDWPIAAGHRVGVLLSDADTDQFTHVPTNSDVTVTSASIALPFLTRDRRQFLDGDSTPRLEAYLKAPTTTLSPAFLAAHEVPFTLPGRLR
ncbi:MAG: putative secreted protein [Frankiales bacterium]|nr:putative secreted protein [Frankiales bacterium]